MRRAVVFGSVLVLMACSQGVETSPLDESPMNSVLMDQTDGCLKGPVAQFGKYIGDWDIQDWQLGKDGTTWTEQQGARWNFTCVGNGVAVQDFWMPNTGGYGTNLRIYEPKTESWEIAWSATGSPGFSHIGAKEDESGNIVMHYISPEQNPSRRITFYPPGENGWDWLLEMSFDGEKTWTAVYKIKATRR